MPKGRQPRPMPEGSMEKLRAALKKARTVGQHKRVQAVWMRALGFNIQQVAAVLDWRPNHVSKVQCQYLREGDAAFQGRGRGGDRRPDNLPRATAQALLSDLLYLKQSHGLHLTVLAVKGECEAATGHPITKATVYRIIQRQGWQPSQLDRGLAPVIRFALSPEGESDPMAREFLRSALPWIIRSGADS